MRREKASYRGLKADGEVVNFLKCALRCISSSKLAGAATREPLPHRAKTGLVGGPGPAAQGMGLFFCLLVGGPGPSASGRGFFLLLTRHLRLGA